MLQYKIRNKLKKKKQLRKSIRSREHIKEKRKTERLRRGPIKICQESIKKKNKTNVYSSQEKAWGRRKAERPKLLGRKNPKNLAGCLAKSMTERTVFTRFTKGRNL